MPGLFGGEAVSQRKQTIVKVVNYSMLLLTSTIPFVYYSFLWYGHIRFANEKVNQVTKKNYQLVYIVLSMVGGLLQAISAFTLCYAVIKIRILIGKQGLAKQVNYNMFLVNAAALTLYMIAVCVWYYAFYRYTTAYYNVDTLHSDK